MTDEKVSLARIIESFYYEDGMLKKDQVILLTKVYSDIGKYGGYVIEEGKIKHILIEPQNIDGLNPGELSDKSKIEFREITKQYVELKNKIPERIPEGTYGELKYNLPIKGGNIILKENSPIKVADHLRDAYLCYIVENFERKNMRLISLPQEYFKVVEDYEIEDKIQKFFEEVENQSGIESKIRELKSVYDDLMQKIPGECKTMSMVVSGKNVLLN